MALCAVVRLDAKGTTRGSASLTAAMMWGKGRCREPRRRHQRVNRPVKPVLGHTAGKRRGTPAGLLSGFHGRSGGSESLTAALCSPSASARLSDYRECYPEMFRVWHSAHTAMKMVSFGVFVCGSCLLEANSYGTLPLLNASSLVVTS